MARIRTIKPEYWTSEQVMSVSRDARLLFIGMWNFADDGGNQPANAKTIKAQIFPCDELSEGDVTGFIGELLAVGLLETYEADCRWYWNIPTWKKHQRIDQPTYRHPTNDGRVPQSPSRRRGSSQSVQGVFGEQTANVQQVFDAGKERNGMDRNGEEVITDSTESADQALPSLPPCPQQKILALFSKYLPELPQPRVWDGQRAKNMRSRWRWMLTAKDPLTGKQWAEDEAQALRVFEAVFALVAKSDFLTGRSGKWSGCSLDWLMKAANFNKVLDGVYDGGGNASR